MPLSQVVATTTTGALYDTVPPNKSILVDNNGGAASKITSTTSADMVGVSVAREDVGVFGSTVVDGVNTDKALTAGTFAYDNESPVAKKVTTSLSGVTDPFYSVILLSAASIPSIRESIHYQKVKNVGYIEGVRTRRQTTAIREGRWNEYTGEFDPGYPLVVVDAWPNDIAASPSRTYPGRLLFKGSSPNPTYAEYSKKTG